QRRPPAAAASLLLVVAVAAGYYVLRPQSGPPPAHPPARLAVLITSLCFASDQVGWVGSILSNTGGGPILATTDGGKHWVRQLSIPDSAATWMRFFDTRHGYALEMPF